MSDFLQQLNESQREAVLYNDGPSLVIAGAGSGKTRVLTYKIAYLLDSGISPYNILALTFTNKAAREMKSRIGELVGDETAKRLWMGTFHSIFSRILRREADKVGFSSDFTIYDAQDSKSLLKTIIKDKGLAEDKNYKTNNIQARISKAKNALITPNLYEKDKELIADDGFNKRSRTSEIYTAYWNRCRMANAMDFDDLLLYTYILFRDNPDITAKYCNGFRFILVDEYQDTNPVQYEIVKLLAADHRRVCVVGDDAQSIYSFRGATIGNILNFNKIYPEAKVFKLEQNYRSTQTIVNAANSIIKNNREQIPKTVFSKNSVGNPIEVIGSYSDFEEGYNVSSRIAEMRMLKNYNYNNFAILYRTNAQSRIFEESLRKINIPYRIVGGLSFYQRKEIKDIIAYLRLISNHNDEEAFKRIINYPARGIGKTTIDKITSTASIHGVSLWDVTSNPLEYNLNVNNGTLNKLNNFCTLITNFAEFNKENDAYEVGQRVIKLSGIIADITIDQTAEGKSRIQNVEEFLNSLYEFVSVRREEDRDDIKISDFLAEISLLTDLDADKDENEEDRVTLMTIHSAKGLEFKNVFIVGLEEGLFPNDMCNNNPKEIEEERRLFYVAVTRAEENAVLTYAKSRFRHGQSEFTSPSRFLRDISDEYLKYAGQASFGQPKAQKAPINKQTETTYNIPRKLTRINDKNISTPKVQNIGSLEVGATIKHERFGIGKVVELTGEGDNAKASIEFDTLGKKQLLLKFAKFTIL
ncbi:DNA helicase-2/ATP-dependent DNA helicase PcrA [Dysgonomonadaceae bacterium PH5-43]|nr:DNA helicase-2/ATP-dependent DNA helicase PcrA [Dysgonomonadaceae bacterium PH5-43]